MKNALKSLWNKKIIRVLSCVILILTIVVTTLLLFPSPQNVQGENRFIRNINQGKVPHIAAHQGSEYLYPSNTIIAFKETLENYGDIVTMFEIDVRMTSDGVLMVQHDHYLSGRTNISKDNEVLVKDVTYDWLMKNVDFAGKFKDLDGKPFDYKTYIQKYPTWIEEDSSMEHGYRVHAATLEQFFDEFAFGEYQDLVFSIDIKDTGELGKKSSDEMNRILTSSRYEGADLLGRVIIASFSDDNFNYVQDKYPHIIQSPARGGVTEYVVKVLTLTDLFFTNDIIGFQIPTSEKAAGIEIRLDYSYFVSRAHRHNMMVQYWTIDQLEEMKYLINIGADCIITNRPDIARQALQELKLI